MIMLTWGYTQSPPFAPAQNSENFSDFLFLRPPYLRFNSGFGATFP